MRLWVPVAVGGVIFLAYAFFYTLSTTETEGTTSIGIANSIGLVAVLLGLLAAGLLLRRAAPQR